MKEHKENLSPLAVLSQAVPAVLMGTKNFNNTHNVATQKRNSWAFFRNRLSFCRTRSKNKMIFRVLHLLSIYGQRDEIWGFSHQY